MNDEEPLAYTVLDALATGADTLTELVIVIGGAGVREVDEAVRWAVRSGFVTAVELPDAYHFHLTPQGQDLVAMRKQMADTLARGGRIDLATVSDAVGSSRAAAQVGHLEQLAREMADHRASDTDREAAVGTLADAYAAGKIDSAELERRNGLALSAGTRGQLAAAVEGLVAHPVAIVPGLEEYIRALKVRRYLFYVFAGCFLLVWVWARSQGA